MDLGPAGRGGARRRTRRRMTAAGAVAASSQQKSPAAAPTTTGNDPASMLEMLKVLHSAGILSDDEFSAKKMQVVDLM